MPTDAAGGLGGRWSHPLTSVSPVVLVVVVVVAVFGRVLMPTQHPFMCLMLLLRSS